MKDAMNSREQITAVANWLGWQEESLAMGLVNALDALRLYDYAQENPDLPELADEWLSDDRIKALGYDPLSLPEAASGRDVEDTGAAKAWSALVKARTLIDSVAYVAVEGDTAPVLAEVDQVLYRPGRSKRKRRK